MRNREPEQPADPAAPRELVALSVLALDYEPPWFGWRQLLEAEGIEQVVDDLGRAAIARSDARRLLADRRDREARAAAARAAAEDANRPLPVVGIPANTGHAIADMMIACGDAPPRVVTEQEFLDGMFGSGPREERV